MELRQVFKRCDIHKLKNAMVTGEFIMSEQSDCSLTSIYGGIVAILRFSWDCTEIEFLIEETTNGLSRNISRNTFLAHENWCNIISSNIITSLSEISDNGGIDKKDINKIKIVTETSKIININELSSFAIHPTQYLIWSNDKKSRLIESILLNIPIPNIYVVNVEYNNNVIVDGVQRIQTLQKFINNEFTLSGLDVYDYLNGLSYSDLSYNMRVICDHYNFNVTKMYIDSNNSNTLKEIQKLTHDLYNK